MALKKFFYTGGSQLAPAALKSFEDKNNDTNFLWVINKDCFLKEESQEIMQMKFLHSILVAPSGTANAVENWDRNVSKSG